MILDCTLRDGGYYNKWDFDRDLVKAYLTAMSDSNVDYVEIGFRTPLKYNKYLGPYAYTSDEYISTLDLPGNLLYAVMLNASEFFQCDDIEREINRLFSERKESLISLVRVAVAAKDAINKKINILLQCIKDKGYQVALNFMQVSSVSDDYLGEVIDQVPGEYVDIIYFADSFGDMCQSDVYRVAEIIDNHWHGSIGIHAHNNKGNALSNTLAAATANVTWLDSTVLGMGRGAGNVPTEILLLEQHKGELKNWNSESMFHLIYKYLQPLQKKYGWGHSFLFHYAAEFSIHPSYIQDLTADESYTPHEIYSALTYLTDNESRKYNSELLSNVNSQQKSTINYPHWDPTKVWSGRDVLIIGSGPSLVKYAKDIESYIRKNSPIVLSLNMHEELEQDLIDGVVAINLNKILIESYSYKTSSKVFFTNINVLPKSILDKVNIDNVRNYKYEISNNNFLVSAEKCVLPSQLSFSYAVAIAMQANAENIYMVGFDGYHTNDEKQQQMIDFIRILNDKHHQPLTALTPSSYQVKGGSLYETY